MTENMGNQIPVARQEAEGNNISNKQSIKETFSQILDVIVDTTITTQETL